VKDQPQVNSLLHLKERLGADDDAAFSEEMEGIDVDGLGVLFEAEDAHAGTGFIFEGVDEAALLFAVVQEFGVGGFVEIFGEGFGLNTGVIDHASGAEVVIEFVFASAEEGGNYAAGGKVAVLIGDEFAAAHGGSLKAEHVAATHEPPLALISGFADDAAGAELEGFGVKGAAVEKDLIISKDAMGALDELGVLRR